MPIQQEVAVLPHPRLYLGRLLHALTIFIIAAASLLLGIAPAMADQLDVKRSRPNVVLILIDDLGWADLTCYGSKFYKTPHLDRLAASGQRFTQGYAACPVCSPTRAALLTGKYPARLHLTDWLPGRGDRNDQKLLRPKLRQQLPLDEVTLAERLHEAGYVCASIGKWHLGGAGFEPTRQGFDLNIAGDDRGSPASYFAPYLRDKRVMPGLENAPDGEFLTERLTAEAERFITSNRERPFFLYLPHFTVHTPIRAREEVIAKYAAWDGTPHGRQENPHYAAMVESMDDSVGRVLNKLDELKLADNTIVIFTSDNGGLATNEGRHTPSTINAPLREGKGWLYEGGIRVPLIVRAPGCKTGLIDSPAWSCDVLPTVLELCGLAPQPNVDGTSLAGVLRNPPSAPKTRTLYWHYPHYANQGGKPGAVVRDGDWKLIEFYETGRRELFDVNKDPRESNNLAEKLPAEVERLAAMLASWRSSVDAQMPTPNPNYVANPQAADGSITLSASSAEVHGVMLRYEPLPHKNTLGFWVRADDWAHWDFTVKTPGSFQVEGLIGCGKGSGGAEVDFVFGEQKLSYTVVETGGFQAFKPTPLGSVQLPAGQHRVEIRVRSKKGPAVMDIRQLKLSQAG